MKLSLPFVCLICLSSVALIAGCDNSVGRPPATSNKTDGSNSGPQTSSDNNQATMDQPSKLEFGDKFPEVIGVEYSHIKNDRWQFNVTLSSLYDTPERYADAWRVLDDQDNELGIRILGHDHQNQQPFTRSQVIEVPAGNIRLFVEGRDQANGWSGQRFEIELK